MTETSERSPGIREFISRVEYFCSIFLQMVLTSNKTIQGKLHYCFTIYFSTLFQERQLLELLTLRRVLVQDLTYSLMWDGISKFQVLLLMYLFQELGTFSVSFFRNSQRRFSIKKIALNNYTKLTGKHLPQSLFCSKSAVSLKKIL